MRAGIAALVWLLAAACGGSSNVAAADLAPIIERDSIAFDLAAVPTEVIDRLAEHRVVIIGETHLVREQRELTAALVEGLHARGFRQLLLEWPHMVDWMLSDFVLDGGRAPHWWQPPDWFLGDLIKAVRQLNRTLPDRERIDVRAIDVNLDGYGGAADFYSSLSELAKHLDARGPLVEFLASGYPQSDDPEPILAALRGELDEHGVELIESWGQEWYGTIGEMIDVEMASVAVRAAGDSTEGSRLREAEMKRMADLRLDGYAHSTMVNVGGNHAQKARLKGTEQEWLGDYLVHASPVTGGSVISVAVAPSRIVADYETDVPDFDLADASPEDELFLLMAETWPDQYVFLSFDDPLFSQSDVAMNWEETIYSSPPKRHYDAMFLLPTAHRIPIP